MADEDSKSLIEEQGFFDVLDRQDNFREAIKGLFPKRYRNMILGLGSAGDPMLINVTRCSITFNLMLLKRSLS